MNQIPHATVLKTNGGRGLETLMKHLLLIAMMFFQTPPARPAGSSLGGRIVYSDGMPVIGSIVSLVTVPEGGRTADRPSPRLAFLDTSGLYRVQNVAPGRYYLRLGSVEPAIYYPGVTSENAASVVVVAADTNINDLNFVLPASLSGVRVSGRVLVPPNQPVQTATQRVQVNGPTLGRAESAIAEDGSFEILHLRPGRYDITVAQTPGMQPQPLIVSDRDLTGVQLRIPRLMSITGTVTTEGGAARPAFNVAIESAIYRTNALAGADGAFTAKLPEAEYLLRVTGLAAGYYVKSITADKTDLISNPLKVVATDAAIPIQVLFATSPGVTVSGRVTGTEPGATRARNGMLIGRAVDRLIELPIEPDGSFKLEKAMPGSYFARITLASNLAAPFVPVTIPAKDVTDLAIVIPPEVEVSGRVTVSGYGPPPKFSLLLVGGSTSGLSPSKPGDVPSLNPAALFAHTRGSGDGMQPVQLNINALPDGSFRMKLPEGEYRVAAAPGANAIPPAYVLQSLTYGVADLLKEPMTVSAAKSSELQIGFGTAEPNPWIRVSGRVVGFDTINRPLRVSLESRTTSTIETPLNPDGTFEFPAVLTRTSYTARVVPTNDAATAPPVAVENRDVTDIEITVPREKEIRIVSSIEEGGPVPAFVMSFTGTGKTESMVTITVRPERDGSFRAKLPADERRVRLRGFPLGYIVKLVSYASTDLLKQPLNISNNDSPELKVVFALDPEIPLGNLKGRVIGLDPQAGGAQLVLNGATSFSTFETGVSADGSFSFSRIPQGAYVPAVTGYSGLLSPSTVVVSGTDLFGIEITVPKQSTWLQSTTVDEGPTGVAVSNLSGSRENANESSAVANLRTINTALVTFLSTNNGRYGNIPDLIKAGLLDARFNGVVSGFNFSVIAVGPNYTAAAIPASQGTARYGYYSTPDAIIRYSTLEMLSPPRQGGNAVQ